MFQKYYLNKQSTCEVSMNDLENYKRARKYKKYDKDFPKGILDVIETDYPDRYVMMLEDRTRIKTLFSDEEWIDILTKSRNSYESHINRIEKTRNHLTFDNKQK